MPRIFLILGCHMLLPVCVQDRLQPLDGSTPRPRLAGEGWVPDQPEGGRAIPGLGRFPGEGNGYPRQYSGLQKSMDCIGGRKESDATEQLT